MEKEIHTDIKKYKQERKTESVNTTKKLRTISIATRRNTFITTESQTWRNTIRQKYRTTEIQTELT